jgi:hypothetical protein
MIGLNERHSACGILEPSVACLFTACSIYNYIMLLDKENIACLILLSKNWNPKEIWEGHLAAIFYGQ